MSKHFFSAEKKENEKSVQWRAVAWNASSNDPEEDLFVKNWSEKKAACALQQIRF